VGPDLQFDTTASANPSTSWPIPQQWSQEHPATCGDCGVQKIKWLMCILTVHGCVPNVVGTLFWRPTWGQVGRWGSRC